MLRFVFPFIVSLIVVGSLATNDAIRAEEPRAQFLQALRANGYEDMSIEYLRQLANRPDVDPSELETLDLEISTSYRIWSLRMSNPESAKQYRDSGQSHFDQFARQHPQHPAIARARYEWGNALLQHASSIATSVDQPFAKSTDAQLEQCRNELKEAESHLQQANAEFQDQLSKGPTTAHSDSELGLVQSMLSLSICRYYLALSSVNSEEERKQYLNDASNMLDSICRKYHEFEIGLEAQLWHAKVLQKLGDDAALDVFDEVLASEPEDPKTVRPEMAALYAEATLLRLQMMRTDSDPLVVLKEADDWMRNHEFLKDTDMFRGIALQAAEIELELSEKAQKPALKAKMQKSAETKIFNVASAAGKYQQAAIRLRQQEIGSGRMKNPLTFEEQIAVAEIAARKTDWAGAIELLNGLLDQARSDKNTQRVTDLQQRISKYRYQLAVKYFDDGEWEQAIQEAGNVARTDKDQPTAPLAADLAGQAALKLFLAADATAKPTALGRLKNIVNFSSETWPDLEVAGNGQLILAEAYLFQNDLDNVMQILDRITHQQHVAPTVAMAAGRLYYKMYVDQRKKPGSDESEKQLQLLRENADRTFSIALAALPTPDPIQPEGRMASEAQILRAELLLDSQQPEAASKCIEPLYTVISATSGPTSDALLIRIATIALRTQLLMKDVERAPGTAEVLMQFNVDQPAANSALVQVASLLAKRVLVEEKENQDAPKVMQLGEEPRDRKLLKELVKHLASRTQLNQRQMISVAEQSAALELWEPILLIAKSFFSQFDSDATFRAAANDGQPKMRLLYARALRRTDDAEAARQQIEVLVKEHPERLDALLEQVRILEQLSKSNTKYCQACVEQGTKLRKLLSRIQPRRPEYYEVILATARCLLLQSKKSKGGEQIKQAEQLLKATLTLSPDLSGPQMQEQYRKLLREITEVRATAK